MICEICEICEICGKVATDKHHIIFKSQGGTNNKNNIAYLCRNCHYIIHHGSNVDAKRELLKQLYNRIKPVIDECWKGKIKPKVVRLIETGFINEVKNEDLPF